MYGILNHGKKEEIEAVVEEKAQSLGLQKNDDGLYDFPLVIYPEFKEKSDSWCSTRMKKQVKDLWDKLPKFRDNMDKVATLHVPYKKSLIISALKDPDFKVQTMTDAGQYHYKLDW